jgi:hypothetical protein
MKAAAFNILRIVATCIVSDFLFFITKYLTTSLHAWLLPADPTASTREFLVTVVLGLISLLPTCFIVFASIAIIAFVSNRKGWIILTVFLYQLYMSAFLPSRMGYSDMAWHQVVVDILLMASTVITAFFLWLNESAHAKKKAQSS